jgi:hypothetical protein
LFKNTRLTDKCPYHPQGKHTAAECAQNPANAHAKAFDKFRQKQRPGADKRNGKNERRGKAEAHIIEASIDASYANNADPDRVEFVAAYNTNVAQSLTGGFNVADFPVTETMTRETMYDIEDNGLFPPGERWDSNLMSRYEFAHRMSHQTNVLHSSFGYNRSSPS